MSEENKTVEKQCFCQSEFFKRFSSVALGTFVGGFCALSLFVTLNRPPMMMPMGPMGGFYHPHHHMMMHGDFGHRHHKFNHDCKCKKEMMKKHFEKKQEFKKKVKEELKENKD